MFPVSVNRHIDEHLKNVVLEIETKNPDLSVFTARQFRYNLFQNTVELTIKEPRQFNVLEEFIIRAGLEFDPPPTSTELASVLGLDAVFVNNTIATLQSLQTLSLDSTITVTNEGRLFYEKGTVPQPPYTVTVYAICDALEESVIFQSEYLDDVSMKLPDLTKVVKISDKSINISALEIEKIQNIVKDSDLTFHVPEQGKIVTDFQVIPPTKNIWQSLDLLVIFNAKEDIFNIQVCKGEEILKPASKKINSLLKQGKIYLTELCELSNENIALAREEIIQN
ncbi:hypothetical protein WJM97_19205 [Okeanomitos corallinicola TIOX110]|uniref:Uncharacterized protein n=1 Tax=Okeanomitos corallinicola TIOX110 TaxID=3133117 RepID=A0ABZ2UR44_9CYAN